MEQHFLYSRGGVQICDDKFEPVDKLNKVSISIYHINILAICNNTPI